MGTKQLTANDRQVGGNHYKKNGLQHWDVVVEMNWDYFQGQITKYLDRHKRKNGLEDLMKARHYLDKYIEVEYPAGARPKRLAQLKPVGKPSVAKGTRAKARQGGKGGVASRTSGPAGSVARRGAGQGQGQQGRGKAAAGRQGGRGGVAIGQGGKAGRGSGLAGLVAGLVANHYLANGQRVKAGQGRRAVARRTTYGMT